jgi:hypothetical protein
MRLESRSWKKSLIYRRCMKVSKHYPRKYQNFLNLAIQETGYSEEQIGDLLKANFGTFNLADLQKYRDYIYGLKEAEDNRAKLREQLIKTEGPKCPICGAAISTKYGRRGRYTKTPEWMCDEGGLTHFLWDKANTIVKLQNEKFDEDKPVPFPIGDWEIKDEETIGPDDTGDGDTGSSGSSADPRTDSGVAGIQQGDTGGISACPPERL